MPKNLFPEHVGGSICSAIAFASSCRVINDVFVFVIVVRVIAKQ